ncbi:BnaCnng76380D [Brassica napus]|uniref:(rape) hypothetical protein n=1 Tax=Brassica napus TaxID=3708 RepID=A0A078K0H9_BRANA|nr:unnamed protein product [Brassica napus]CAF2290108.1 unnamed protein product [Brassica napus]CDY72185.1 BnaCnng76380D [Brassica napus]
MRGRDLETRNVEIKNKSFFLFTFIDKQLNFTVNTLCHGFISFELLPLRTSFVLSKEFSYNNGGAAKNWPEENGSSCIKLLTGLCELICLSCRWGMKQMVRSCSYRIYMSISSSAFI